VVARDVRIKVTFDRGVRPVRVLGRKSRIYGREVVARINQIYAAQEKFLMIEAAVPPGADGSSRALATVTVTYDDAVTARRETENGLADLRFSSSELAVQASENDEVLVSTIALEANEKNRLALSLRDRGETQRAEQVLDENVLFLEKKSKKLKSKKLEKLAKDNRQDRQQLSAPEPAWRAQRKAMRKRQSALDMQQMW
jgi:Ca-activated chloride channel family protein